MLFIPQTNEQNLYVVESRDILSVSVEGTTEQNMFIVESLDVLRVVG